MTRPEATLRCARRVGVAFRLITPSARSVLVLMGDVVVECTRGARRSCRVFLENAADAGCCTAMPTSVFTSTAGPPTADDTPARRTRRAGLRECGEGDVERGWTRLSGTARVPGLRLRSSLCLVSRPLDMRAKNPRCFFGDRDRDRDRDTRVLAALEKGLRCSLRCRSSDVSCELMASVSWLRFA